MIRRKKVIQFTHPGNQHEINLNSGDLNTSEHWVYIKSWNNKQHARKYIRTLGSFVSDIDETGVHLTKGNVDFWGEWEAESVAKKLNYEFTDSYTDQYPKYIHYPFYTNSNRYPNPQELQNTDPLVLDKKFYYTCCKQRFTNDLQVGAIILFGSCPGQPYEMVDGVKKRKTYGKFIVDTVFVIRNIIKSDKNVIEQYNTPEHSMFYDCVLHKIHYGHGSAGKDNIDHTIYEGATIEQPYNGMFSYFPCKPSKNVGDVRLELDKSFDERVSTTLMAAPKNIVNDGNDQEIRAFWDKLAKYTLEQGYYLGIKTEQPEYFENTDAIQQNPQLLMKDF